MAQAAIPVDLFNPGQVFACLGFLEAADVLLGDAEGGFDWSDEANVNFRLRAAGEPNPVAVVLAFLAEAETAPFASSAAPADTFPARRADHMALPIRFDRGDRPPVMLGHWADGSSRQSFKLYAGNRSADGIARAMLKGVRAKPSKAQRAANQPGDLETMGIAQLWHRDPARLTADPFGVLTAMGGSFNFDPRGAWTAIDAGYSPNAHNHHVNASPVVEFLAAWGLEHARPRESERRRVAYAAWDLPLPPILARPALVGAIPALPSRHFRFELDLSGKNKVVTFAREEHAP